MAEGLYSTGHNQKYLARKDILSSQAGIYRPSTHGRTARAIPRRPTSTAAWPSVPITLCCSLRYIYQQDFRPLIPPKALHRLDTTGPRAVQTGCRPSPRWGELPCRCPGLTGEIFAAALRQPTTVASRRGPHDPAPMERRIARLGRLTSAPSLVGASRRDQQRARTRARRACSSLDEKGGWAWRTSACAMQICLVFSKVLASESLVQISFGRKPKVTIPPPRKTRPEIRRGRCTARETVRRATSSGRTRR